MRAEQTSNIQEYYSTPYTSDGYDKSERILDRVFEEMSIRVSVDEDGYESRYPANLMEIDIIKAGLKRLDQIGCSDPNILDRMRDWKRVSATAAKRSFHGSWKLLILTLAAVLVFNYAQHPFTDKSLPNEQAAQTALKNELVEAQTMVKARRDLLKQAPLDKKQYWQNSLDQGLAELRHLKSLTPAQYRTEFNDAEKQRLFSARKTFFLWLLLPVLYFLSALTPMYLVMRRRKAIDRWRTAWGIAGKILAVIVGVVMAVEATTYVTRWSDGSRTEDSDAASLAFLQLGFLAIVAILLLFFAIYVAPVLTVCNFILNYTPGLGERMLPKRPLPAF
jgi:hypothetical protein